MHSDNNGRPVSSCCGASIFENITDDKFKSHNNNKHEIDTTQGCRHNIPIGSTSGSGYPQSIKTLRDEVAMACLQSLLSNSKFEEYRQTLDGIYSEDVQTKALMMVCFGYADAFMEARNK